MLLRPDDPNYDSVLDELEEGSLLTQDDTQGQEQRETIVKNVLRDIVGVGGQSDYLKASHPYISGVDVQFIPYDEKVAVKFMIGIDRTFIYRIPYTEIEDERNFKEFILFCLSDVRKKYIGTSNG